MRTDSGFVFRNVNKGAMIENINNLEIYLNFKLPVEYKDLLSKFDGGEIEFNQFNRIISPGQFQNQSLDCLLNIVEIKKNWDNIKEYPEIIDTQIIPFASTLGSTILGIGYGQNNYGKIFAFDWDFGLTLQAESLEDFFRQLEYEE